MQLSPEEKLLLSVVKINPSAEELGEINALIPQMTDWVSFTEKLIAHGSAPLFYKKLALLSNQPMIPAAVRAQLQQVYYKTLTRSMLLQDAFKTVVLALQEVDIQLVALKGVYLSQYLYPDIALRQFSDIDILVNEADGLKAVDKLQALGFKPFDPNVSEFIASQIEIIHYPPLVKNGVSVEVHIRLHQKNPAYQIRTAEMIRNAVPFQVAGVQAFGLSLYDLLVHLCVHMDKHFVGGHIQMKCFNDIVNIIRLHGNEIVWSDFIENCRLHSCEQLVFKYLLLTSEFYAVALPPDIVNTYHHTVTEKDRLQFIDYLHCEYEKKYHVTTHWHNIREISHPGGQVRYFFELIFPPKSFMVQKYGLDPQPVRLSSRRSLKGNKNLGFEGLKGLTFRVWVL